MTENKSTVESTTFEKMCYNKYTICTKEEKH